MKPSPALRKILLIGGVVGAAATAGVAKHIGLDTFTAEDGAPGVVFRIPPDEIHHIIFNGTSVEERTIDEGVIYQRALGLINPEGGKRYWGFTERRFR